ncbi:hypothetical protein VKT23_016349 [Stygiomarasmius scandens]|uniref:Uncharacterized protein n=1 Tax=Marasmiellus scandens TaxID=2682957 RepID=A0ABR1IXV2_9AGAR
MEPGTFKVSGDGVITLAAKSELVIKASELGPTGSARGRECIRVDVYPGQEVLISLHHRALCTITLPPSFEMPMPPPPPPSGRTSSSPIYLSDDNENSDNTGTGAIPGQDGNSKPRLVRINISDFDSDYDEPTTPAPIALQPRMMLLRYPGEVGSPTYTYYGYGSVPHPSKLTWDARRAKDHIFLVVVGSKIGLFYDWTLVLELTDTVPGKFACRFETFAEAKQYYRWCWAEVEGYPKPAIVHRKVRCLNPIVDFGVSGMDGDVIITWSNGYLTAKPTGSPATIPATPDIRPYDPTIPRSVDPAMIPTITSNSVRTGQPSTGGRGQVSGSTTRPVARTVEQKKRRRNH